MVKGLQSKLNSEVDVVSVGSGAYCSFKETLSSALRHVVSCTKCLCIMLYLHVGTNYIIYM